MKILLFAGWISRTFVRGVTLKMHNTNKLKLRLRLAQTVKILLFADWISRTLVRVAVGEKAHYDKILRYADMLQLIP